LDAVADKLYEIIKDFGEGSIPSASFMCVMRIFFLDSSVPEPEPLAGEAFFVLFFEPEELEINCSRSQITVPAQAPATAPAQLRFRLRNPGFCYEIVL
jgi:hypothetical protein